MTTAREIKSLRDHTGISVAECKRALEATDGDEDRAIEWLRRSGEQVAGKKAARALGAGAVSAYVHSTGTLGALVELRSETDFVAKNQDFRSLADDLAMQIAAMAPPSTDELLAQSFIKDSNQTIAEVIRGAIQKFGERIEIGVWYRLDARPDN